MKKKLTNNLGMKIISVVLAIIFWLVVVSIEDPEQTKVIELPVTKTNENLFAENDKTYEVISGNTVDITIRARQSILKNLTARDFEAVADFSKLSFTGAIPIEITPLRYAGQVTIVKGANMMMQVSIEDLASTDKVIAVKSQGRVIEGKALGNMTADPNMIRIEGAKTTIDRISNVYAEINVSGLSKNGSFVVEPVLYDSAGNKIDSTDVHFSADKVKVDVELLNTKVVPVRWTTDVRPADGYGIASLDYTPSEVEIAGSPEVLQNINEIVLDDYVADNLSEDMEYEVDLESIVKNKGAILSHPDEDKIVKLVVKLDVYKQEDATLAFKDLELTGKSDQYKYSLEEGTTINYSLYGIASDLKLLDRTKLRFQVDVSGLEPGVHTVTLQMKGSEKVRLGEGTSIKIKIEAK